MYSSRTDLTNLFEAAAALLDDPADAEVDLSWWSNGSRGIRHADLHCWKFKRGESFMKHQASFRVMLSVRQCPDCYDSNIWRISSSPMEFKRAVTAIGIIKHNLEMVGTADVNLKELSDALQSLRQQYKQLGELDAHPDATDGYRKGLRLALERAKFGMFEAKRLLLERSMSIMPAVAVAYMTPTGNDYASVASKHQFAVLEAGRVSYGRRGSIAELFNAWSSELQYHGFKAPGRPERLDTQVGKGFSLTVLEQLSEVPLHRKRGQSALEASKASWVLEKDQLAKDLLASWDAKVEELVQFTDMQLVGLRRPRFQRSDPLLVQALEAFLVAENPERQTLVLRVPELVLMWFSKAITDTVRVGGEYISIVQPGESDASLEEAETAAVLWDPTADTDGAYASFKDALVGAKAIMA